ncbi:MAG: class I SAM-dependent methyltransferase [Acidobacteria bacterium]|nr:class I SAM-dependent methyltransferase [Acidobacteriota bacterium]
MSSPVTPLRFFDAVNGYQRTAVVKAALDLDVFSHIAGGSETAREIAGGCDASERGVRVLCDALTVLGMLEKQEGRYRLTADSALFLDRGSPSYIGASVEYLCGQMQTEGFAQFTEAVRRGGTALGSEGCLAPDHPAWAHFARSMTGVMRPLAEFVAAEAGPVQRVLDVACGHGLYAIALAEANESAEVYALDWPHVLDVAQRHARQAGVASRFHLIPGNAFTTAFGAGYDVIVLANFLHCLDSGAAVQMARMCHAALKPGGRLLVVAFVPDAARTRPSASAWFATVMLATTPGGDAYTKGEYDAMLAGAGFPSCRLVEIPGSAEHLLIATK